MELKTIYYEEMFDRFSRQCPYLAKDAVDYVPKHTHAIRVTLRDGSKVDYNAQTDSFRRVEQYMVTNPDDITDENCRSAFAANLSEIMVMRGIGQAVLAERTGLSSAIISKYLHRKATPTITSVRKIARALNCHPDELYE